MRGILDRIAADKQREVEQLKKQMPLARLEQGMPDRPRNRLLQALRDPTEIRIIAELKKGSPSRGVIAPDFDPVGLALDYRRGGAAALSIVTERNYFYGSYDYVAPAVETTGLPALCKDFVVDPYQLYHARWIGADGVLLIVRLHSKSALTNLLRLAGQLGLDCLVEVHDETELDVALAAGASLIGINNRNLADFTVDLAVSERLGALLPADVVGVSESGILGSQDIKRLRRVGFSRFLVGELLVKATDAAALIRELRQA
jgi:indole-3-glycerol phosphate synthase